MRHKELSKREVEQAVIAILDTLLDDSVPFSGAHRKCQWERGWSENLKSGDVTPRYFGKYPINRLHGEFVWGLSENYERDMLYTLVDALAHRYLRRAQDVYEFGCGTGHNLLRVQKVNPKATLHGFDWTRSSNALVRKLGFHAEQFDYFNPPKIDLAKGAAVFTVASLEQTGTNYKKFVKYLLYQKPSVVVHIEPMPEFLDPTNLLDYLSIKYMEKRKYLSGYPTYIRELEKEGKVKILEARRSGVGSFFIDGYSILVWKPL